MLFKYPLTDSQYARFQHANNNAQIQELGRKAGVIITDEYIAGGVEEMQFRGRCNGTMALVKVKDHWECWIQVRSKPFWLPWFILDWGFKEALK